MKQILIFFAVLLLAGCAKSEPDADFVMDGTPEITFSETDQSLLEMDEGEVRNFEYRFKNTGTAPLMILDIDVTCGCTLTSWNLKPIRPGEEGVIKVSFDSSHHQTGVKKNRIDVFTNGNYVRLFFTTEII